MNIQVHSRTAIIGVAALFLLFTLFVHFQMAESDAFRAASAYLQANGEVARLAGTVQKTSLSWGSGQVRTSGESGTAYFTVNIVGAIDSPKAYVELRRNGAWEISFAQLIPVSWERLAT